MKITWRCWRKLLLTYLVLNTMCQLQNCRLNKGGWTMEKIIAACGNDCAACPRYVAHPYEKTDEELRHTAQLWMKIGYRDHIVTDEEISWRGCKPENWCRYRVVKCCEDRGIKTCADCRKYPCDNMKECFEVTRSFMPKCREVCTDEEFQQLNTAFFEKEKNLSHELKKTFIKGITKKRM